MSQINQAEEYVIELPGRGWIDWMGEFTDKEQLSGIEKFEDVEKMLKSATKKYIGMGCPEVAETLRIVKRTVTVTCGDWEPI